MVATHQLGSILDAYVAVKPLITSAFPAVAEMRSVPRLGETRLNGGTSPRAASTSGLSQGFPEIGRRKRKGTKARGISLSALDWLPV